MTMTTDSSRQLIRRNFRARFFSSGVHIHNGDVISLVKGRHEVIKQSLRPAVAVGLEDRNNAAVPT